MNDDKDLCPCESGKTYEECCKKAYDQGNARQAILDALKDPKKAKELKDLLKQKQEK